MEKDLIKRLVSTEVENWSKGSSEKHNISLTSQATDFISELIINIKDDPSPIWTRISIVAYDEFQRRTISTIPLALDYMLSRRPKIYINHEIGVWEIWHSLSQILTKFCFIPEKDM